MENEEKNDTQQDLTKYLEGLDKDSIACMKEMAHCNEKDLKVWPSAFYQLNAKKLCYDFPGYVIYHALLTLFALLLTLTFGCRLKRCFAL